VLLSQAADLDLDLDNLLAGNKAWAERMKASDPNFFKSHSMGQCGCAQCMAGVASTAEKEAQQSS
jgi:hypothetical protein